MPGPASRPCPASSLRSSAIRLAVVSGMARGEVFGRRDRGPDAASPSARYRAARSEARSPAAAGSLTLSVPASEARWERNFLPGRVQSR